MTMQSISGVLTLLVSVSVSWAAELTPSQRKAVDEAVITQMQQQHLVGLSMGIIQDGVVAYTAGYGLADREAGTPVTADTMYRWASISKPLTAVAAMQLVDANNLDLDADVRALVPEFPEQVSPITTRQLLGHLAGVVHYRNGPVVPTQRDYAEPHPHADVVQALDTFKASPLVSDPGEAFNYSTHGYILASAVVQRAGKERFAWQVKSRIADPLGMQSLQPDYQWVDIPNRAKGYRKLAGMIVASDDSDVSWKLGGGGWISTIGDLSRFAAGLMGDALLPADAKVAMWTPQRTVDGTATGYGLGFGVSGAGANLKVSHTGAQAKTRTIMSIWPAKRSGVVIMTNSEWVDRDKVMAAITQAMVIDRADVDVVEAR